MLKILLMGLIIANFTVAFADTNNESLIALKKTLPMSVADKASMDKNAYVYMMAIDAADDNYYEVGKNIILEDDEILQKILFTKEAKAINLQGFKNPVYQKLDVIMPSLYDYPCFNLGNLNCINNTTQDFSKIDKLIAENKVILARYKNMILLPDYNVYSKYYNSPWPPYQYMYNLSLIRQAEAIWLINQGKITEGLAIFQQEVDFYKRMLTGKGYIIDAMIAIRMLHTLYQTIGQLMDNPKLINNSQFIALLKPLTSKEQQVIAGVLKRDIMFWLTAANKVEILNDINSDLFNKSDATKPILETMPYDLNKITLSVLEHARSFEVALPESADVYQQLKISMVKQYTIDELEKLRHTNNGLAELFVASKMKQLSEYIFRFYDLINYMALLNTKLAIKQSGIAKADLSSYLKQMGDKAINPYSKQPFNWDEQQQVLSIDILQQGGNFFNSNQTNNMIRVEF